MQLIAPSNRHSNIVNIGCLITERASQNTNFPCIASDASDASDTSVTTVRDKQITSKPSQTEFYRRENQVTETGV
jgi:hypothetical protein